MSHVLEHFWPMDRIAILNELHRILKPGGTALIITPCGDRHFQDPTHKGPPVVAAFYCYVNKAWRKANGLTHNEYEKMTADFSNNINFQLHPEVGLRSEPARLFMATFYNNATTDMYANLTATK
jgi:predicted SAM-dependent methyltransferase